jgi:hypothetical protein
MSHASRGVLPQHRSRIRVPARTFQHRLAERSLQQHKGTDLSDRQAAEAVCCRIDFRYALAMELDDPGFHHCVLADFRERLAQDDRTDRLLDLAPARLKDAGLLRERTTQHTASTHVLAAVGDLTRLG